MLTAVRCVLSKLASPLWRTVEVEEGEGLFSGKPGKCTVPTKYDAGERKFPQLASSVSQGVSNSCIHFFVLLICFARQGMKEIRHLRGSVVTQLCLDYGMIDGAVYFTSGEVLGGMPLKEGDLVNCIAVRDGAQGGWKALRVTIPCFAHARMRKRHTIDVHSM